MNPHHITCTIAKKICSNMSWDRVYSLNNSITHLIYVAAKLKYKDFQRQKLKRLAFYKKFCKVWKWVTESRWFKYFAKKVGTNKFPFI